MKEFINNLSIKLVKEMSAGREDKNVVCSPVSLIILLAIIANAATGDTQKEVLDALGVASIDELNDVVADIERTISASDLLSSANSICVAEDYKDRIKAEFKAAISDLYNAEVMSADKANDLSLTKLVNDWVKEKTNGMIEKLVDSLDGDIKAVLMNALAFEGQWLDEYDDDEITNNSVFNNADGTTSEVTMLTHEEETYIEDDKVIGFIKSYDDLEYSYMTVVPKDKNVCINDILDDITVSDLYRSSKWGKAITTMPEFKVETGEELTNLCKEIGINTAFGYGAELDNMVTHSDLLIDSVIQKACITVDRKGTKAAAVTAGIARCMSMPIHIEPKRIDIDRPFLYAVVNGTLDLPVFIGVVNKL